MTWPANRGYVVKIKASISAGIRPCAMIFHEQPNEPWTEFDFLLLEAYQILKDETCNECGNPVWICRNEGASNVGFKIKTTKCYGKAELERWHEKQEKSKSKKKRYGEIPYISPYTYDDSPMPTRRDYYQYLIESNAVE